MLPVAKLLPHLNVGSILVMPQSDKYIPPELISELANLDPETKLVDIPGEMWVKILGVYLTSTWNGSEKDQRDNAKKDAVIIRCQHCGKINYFD